MGKTGGWAEENGKMGIVYGRQESGGNAKMKFPRCQQK